jgi:hypothetical protein
MIRFIIDAWKTLCVRSVVRGVKIAHSRELPEAGSSLKALASRGHVIQYLP